MNPFLNRPTSVILFVAVIFCVSGSLFAKTPVPPTNSSAIYYLDALNGNDQNTGSTPQKPWKSLSKINATTFAPGDTILLKAGSVWEGQLWPKGSGSPSQPIRLGRYGEGPKPAIAGKGLVEDAVLLRNQEYWEIEDLDVSNHGAKSGVRRGVHVAVENFGEAHHILLRRMTVHDVNGIDDLKANGGVIYTSEGNRKASRFLDLRIEENEIYHVDRNGITGWSDTWERSKWYPSLGVIVRGNKLHDIGGDGILIVATDGALIERNEVGKANQRSSGYNVAIWSWSADNTIVQYNEAWGTKGERDGEGFDSDWNSRNTVIQYNYSHDNDGGFVLICDEGNHPVSESIGNLDTVVRYNISQNDRNRGITLSGPVKNTRIYNNTIYEGTDSPVDVVLFTDWFGWPQATHFFNNIFYASGARIGHAVSRSKETGHHSSAVGFGKSEHTQFGSNVYFGRIEKLEDLHALIGDPEFVAPGRGTSGLETLKGYALGNASTARRSGVVVPENGGKDFFGVPLARCEPPDRGAIQTSACDNP